jgi:POT family proton-dependent oligopeptide transporter
LPLQQRLREIVEGFQPAFWVANATELFERLSYYGQQAVLAIFLHEQLKFTVEETGRLQGFFGFVVWFLPILGGTLADRFGFRRSLSTAYLILSIGYFLLGSLSAGWMAPLREALPLYWLVFAILMVPAIGPSIVKPVVAGTTARASNDNVRSLGYSIYYTLVNIGGFLGPVMAFFVRRSLGIENVFRMAGLSVFIMFFATLIFYREPPRTPGEQVATIGTALRNVGKVLRNVRFMTFLLIFSGFYIVFWQEFIALPLFIRGYVDPTADVDLLTSVEALTVISLQVLVSYMTRKVPAFTAMITGILIAALSWVLLAVHPSVPMAVASLVVLGIGEITQAPRYYEYISRLAPRGQEGLFMGYAFLPIAIGFFIAGPLGGWLLHYFGEVRHAPEQLWLVVAGIGLLTTLLMYIYHRVLGTGHSTSK